MVAKDDFSSKSWFEWKSQDNQKLKHNYRLKWYCLMPFIKQCFSYTFFSYDQSFAILCITWQNMDLRGINYCTFRKQLGRVLNTMKKTWFTELFWSKFKITEIYWSVLENAKTDLWNKAWQLTSSPLNLQTIN